MAFRGNGRFSPAVSTVVPSGWYRHQKPTRLGPRCGHGCHCSSPAPLAAEKGAIPLLPLFPGTRNPRCHQPAETEGLRSRSPPCSRSRPGSRAGARPAASRGGSGGREGAKASVGPLAISRETPAALSRLLRQISPSPFCKERRPRPSPRRGEPPAPLPPLPRDPAARGPSAGGAAPPPGRAPES